MVGRRGTRASGQPPPSAASPTTPKEQDDILPAAYTRRTLVNLCGENFPHPGYAKRVPERTAPRGEASPRAGAMHPNNIGCRTYAYGPVDTTGCPSSTRMVDAA